MKIFHLHLPVYDRIQNDKDIIIEHTCNLYLAALKSEKDLNDDEKPELNPTWMIIQITFVFVSICALILRSFYTICWEEKQVNEQVYNEIINDDNKILVTECGFCRHFNKDYQLSPIFLVSNICHQYENRRQFPFIKCIWSNIFSSEKNSKET